MIDTNIPKSIQKKWYSNPKYYNSDTIRTIEIEEGHTVDIAFIYSGRNRGKSFDISSRALLDAWVSQGEIQFGYARRLDKEIQNFKVEQYFEDKIDFIKDISGNKADCVICYNGALYFGKVNTKGNKAIKEKLFKIGNTFAMSTANQYKSMQYPKITRLLYEEVFTQDAYVPEEPRKLLNLISTIQRSRDNFTAFLISNTVSRVNPYIDDYGLTKMIRQKEGTIDKYKLFKGTFDEQGNEEYYFIACEYLQDAENEDKGKKSKMGTSVLSNKWDETRLYPTMSQLDADKYETDYKAIFQNGAFKFLCEVKNVPINFQVHQLDQDETLSDETMPALFITRLTRAYHYNARIYTTEPIVYPLSTRGIIPICDFDKELIKLIEIGHTYYSTNLIACEFVQCYKQLRMTKGV